MFPLPFLDGFVQAIYETIFWTVVIGGSGFIVLMFVANELRLVEILKWKFWDTKRIEETDFDKYMS